MLFKRRRLMAAVAVCAMVAGAGHLAVVTAESQKPEKEVNETENDKDMRTISGTVKTLSKNDRGDVDGFTLDEGTSVHFPPHLSEDVLGLAGRGHRVTVTGRDKKRPDGEVVFEARSIERGGRTVNIEPPAHPKRGGGPRENETPMHARGLVESLHSNKHGDLDGFLLKDGTEVKFPPHQASELSAIAKVGEELNIDGRRHVTPNGDVHLHADRISNMKTGETLERDEPAGPPHARPPHEAGRPIGPDPVQKEMLDELRAIRRLLERQSGKAD